MENNQLMFFFPKRNPFFNICPISEIFSVISGEAAKLKECELIDMNVQLITKLVKYSF